MSQLLKFSKLKYNAKLNWIKNGYSFSTLAGVACPFADKCKSQVVETENGRRIKDGKNTEFRCFSASQELLFKAMYEQRKHNLELLKTVSQSTEEMKVLLAKSLPSDAKVIRIHISGDYFNQRYFDAWLELAISRPDVLFYGYTKSVQFWVKRLDRMPPNFILTASFGGTRDDTISEFGLRYCKVVYSTYEAKKLGLPIDKDDRFAMLPENRHKNYCLVVHGPGPVGSKHARIWRAQIDGRRKFHGYTSKTFKKYRSLTM